MAIKKLIEVALPLEKINKESAREKAIHHGHPSVLHLWWARRPLATARAVIWSSLVDDPSSHPELFPTVEAQNAERERLFKILEDLVVWENSNNEEVLNKAKAEIKKYNPILPEFLDPFSGGGALPLEAQRLGLVAHAHDLNPVAVMINKAMLEIPPKFANIPPINPEARGKIGADTAWKGAAGLAEDVRYYGEMLKKLAFDKIGHLYPKVNVPKEQGGGEATVVAWLWSRVVTCPNPACHCKSPLIKSFSVCKKNGRKRFLKLVLRENKKFDFLISDEENDAADYTVGRNGAKCFFCGTPISLSQIREESSRHGLETVLTGIICEGSRRKIYVSPNEIHINAANVERIDFELGNLAHYPGYINTNAYGMNTIESLYTNRQLIMMKTFVEGVDDIRKQITEDCYDVGYINKETISSYVSAIVTYLVFSIDKLADYNTSSCSWHVNNEEIRRLLA